MQPSLLSFRHCCLAVMMLCTIGLSPVTMADGTARLQADGRQYEIPLPDGYCDISTSPAGIALKGFLDNLAQTNNLMPEIGVIFQQCGTRQVFPWGYVGTLDGRPLVTTQESLNRLRAQLYGQEDLIGDILGAAGAVNADAMAEMGIDMGAISPGSPTMILAINDAIVSVMITETMVNGQPYSEKMVSSGSVVDGLVFEFVIFDDKGAGGMDTVATSRLLARNARVLKAANAAGDASGITRQPKGKGG